MQAMKFSTGFLLAKLRANRARHIEDYKIANAGFREKAKLLHRKAIKDIERGRPVVRFIELDVPQSHTKDYDCVIGMLEETVDSEVSLTTVEFQCYVKDEWSWREDFKNSTALYSGFANISKKKRR